MQRGTLEKSPSHKDYKQTLEFVQQLKPLKDRYKTEILKVDFSLKRFFKY